MHWFIEQVRVCGNVSFLDGLTLIESFKSHLFLTYRLFNGCHDDVRNVDGCTQFQAETNVPVTRIA